MHGPAMMVVLDSSAAGSCGFLCVKLAFAAKVGVRCV